MSLEPSVMGGSDTALDENLILTQDTIEDIYSWVDGIPLSRPKKNIARDFSDGLMLAEIINHFVPKFVEMHNYVPACNGNQKKINWGLLNRRAFSKLGIRLNDNTIIQLVEGRPGAIEQVLWDVRKKLQEYVAVPKEQRKNNWTFGSSKKTPSTTPKIGSPRIPTRNISSVAKPGVKSATGSSAGTGNSTPRVSNEAELEEANKFRRALLKQSLARSGLISDVDAEVVDPPCPPSNLIIYKGQKMVSIAVVDYKDAIIRNLKFKVTAHEETILRLEHLSALKETHIRSLKDELADIHQQQLATQKK